MDGTTTGVVLLAALLHAGWNAVVKGGGDRFALMVILWGVAGAVSLAILPFLAPPAPASWPYIAASVLLHIGYALFLAFAYDHGDFSQVYPIARGSAPLIVTVVSIGFLGAQLAPLAVIAVLLIICGIVSLARGKDAIQLRPLAYALGTGLFIAAYTLVDGTGARLAGSAHGYTAWMFALFGITFVALFGGKKAMTIRTSPRRFWLAGIGGGLMSLAAYWVVIWAMTVGPIAMVAALRETSVLFAAVIGAVVFGERLGRRRIIAAAIVLFGVVLLRI